jgi:hypothetical protein
MFLHSFCKFDGGALYYFQAPFALLNSSFYNCSSAQYGGSIYVTQTEKTNISRCSFAECMAVNGM